MLIRGGTIVDGTGSEPFSGDVLVDGDTISAVGPTLDAPEDDVIDAAGLFVAPGLIDLHVHCYSGLGLFSVDPADIGLQTGVTTMIDTGSAGSLNYGPFHKFIMPSAAEDVYAFINIAQHGVQGHPDFEPFLGDLHEAQHIHVGNAVACIEAHRDRIVGVKARLTEGLTDGKPENERIAMHAAIEAGGEAGLPCMFHHVASSIPVVELLELMRPGDVLTHFYHGRGDGGFDPEKGAPTEALSRARQRGVILDVGHGVGAFAWRVAEPACREYGFYPDTISTDLHQFCLRGPTYDMPTTMSKLLHLGMPLESVIEASTRAPARTVGLHDRVGCLSPGLRADISLLRIDEGEFDLADVEGEVRVAARRIECAMTIKGGQMAFSRPPVSGAR